MTDENVEKNHENDDAELGTFLKEDGVGKKLDYVAVCVFVYFALDANIETNQLTTALRGLYTYEDGNVRVTNPTKADLAKTLVDKFLCRDDDG